MHIGQITSGWKRSFRKPRKRPCSPPDADTPPEVHENQSLKARLAGASVAQGLAHSERANLHG